MGKYAAIIASSQDEIQKERARYAGIAAPKVSPDQMGKAMDVADRKGLPVGVVADNLGEYDEQDSLDGISAAASTAPALAHWLGDSNHAALAKDDTGVLGSIGTLFTQGLLSQSRVLPGISLPRNAVQAGIDRVRTQEAIDAGPVARAIEQPSWFSELVADFQSSWTGGKAATALTMQGLADTFNLGPTVMDPATGQWTRDRSAELGARVADYNRQAEGQLRRSEATAAGQREIAAASDKGDWVGTAAAAATNPRAVMSVVAQSLGATAPQLALSAAMPASRPVAAITAGAGSFSAEQGFTVLDVMGDAGVDTTNTAQVTAFLRNKPAMQAARTKAAERGVAIATFDALTAGFAGRLLANSRRSFVSIGSRVAGEAAVQAGGGAAGEATAQLATEGRITSAQDVVLEAFAEMPTFLAEGRGQIAEARRAALHNADRFDAQGEQKAIGNLVNLANQSKTKARSASRFESLIQDMTDEGTDTVYLSADGAQKLFQSAAADGGFDMATLVDEAELREAIATGGEVAIPLAKYATLLSPEQHASIADQVRLQPGGRHDLPSISSEDMQAAIEAGITEGRERDERENGPAGQVFDDVFGQLLSKQDEKLARQSASIVQSVYRNLAERSGMDAWQLYQQFRINIPGAKYDSRGQRRGVDLDVDPYLDALRTGKLPTDKDIYGDSLVAALHAAGGIREAGGELANMDAAKQRPGLVNNLAGMTMDEALVWAYQEGFITEAPTQLRESFDGDAPDINTLLDMLAKDLGGNPVYRPGALNAERASFRENATALQEELDAAGVDLSATDNAGARSALGMGEQKQRLVGKMKTDPTNKLWGASTGTLSDGTKRTLMVDPDGGYFWGEYKAGNNSEGALVVEGEHAEFEPAAFNSGTEARSAADSTPDAKDQPRGGGTLYQSPIPEASEVEALRATIAALEKELRTDELTGLRNRRAFNEDENLGWEGVMAFDMDGLTALNKLGHAVGDSALQAIGNIMLASETATARFYHTSGDEFYGRAATMEEAAELAQMIQDKLESVDLNIDVAGPDGNIRELTYRGIGVSRGTGATPNEADQHAIENKSEREATGVRQAKGDTAAPRRLIDRRDSGNGDRRGSERDQPVAGEAAQDGLSATLNQGGAKDNRGSVTFGRDTSGRVFNIELLAGMDASTFMHEMGHVYLEVLNDLAAREGAPAQLTADIATIDEWLGHKAGDAFTVDQHEQWARGFEAYLREGNAPSSALRRVFAAFKVWLTNIYKSIASLQVDLTDDVRGVMDRLVASEAEIAEARQGQYQEALITDAIAVGMSAEQFEAYNRAVQAAQADAEAVVAGELLDAMRREQRSWYVQEKRKLRTEVAAELRGQPIYRALRLLRTGQLPNGDLAPDELRFKLSKEDLLDKYGQSFLRNLRGTYSVEGGVRADEAAVLLGFGSGREMIDAMVNAPKFSESVSSETDARMSVRHPDPMTDGTLPDRALAAAHRDRQADVMVREIQALERHTAGAVRTQAAVVKAVAKAIIAGKTLDRLQPATFRAGEAKAGREAFEAARVQDWPAALAARRRQLLNFELFREASRVREETAKAAKYLARFQETKTRARLGKLGADYLDQIDGLLDRFDFRKISDKAAERRTSFAAWLTEQAAKGLELNIPAKLMDDAFRVPFRKMTVTDMLALRDTVKQIDHLARLKGKLLLAGELRDAEAIDAAMAQSVSFWHQPKAITTGDRLTSDKVRQAFQQGRVLQGTATDIARELDGFTDGGAIWKNTIGVIRNAINNVVNPKLKEAQESLASIYVKHYTKAEIRNFNDRAPMPEVNGDLWSKGRLLSLALNWGNEGNREAVLSQAKTPLTAEQAALLLGRLDARDWAFVEEVANLIGSQWPAIAEAQKRRTGLVPERVDPSPFVVTTSDGKRLSLPGWYYPLKYEADSVKTMKEEVDDFYKGIITGRSAKAATKNGHTIERVGSGGRTVALHTGIIQSHLRDVIRDVYLGDAINYVHNALNGQQFREAVDATGNAEMIRALEVWLKDAATGEIGPRVWHERAMRSARQNFTASVLTFKFVSAALQITGLIQSSVVLGPKNVAAAVSQFAMKPLAMTRYVRQASPYMESRMQTHIEAVQQVMDAEAGRFEAGKSAMIRWGYWMMGRVQQIVDVATWMAAEQQGMRVHGGDIDAARLYADDAVARAQGSGEFIDKTPLQRGTLSDNVRQTEWVKATTTLMGYMLSKGNVAYEQTRKTNFRSPAQDMRWAANMVMLYSMEGIIVAAIRGQLPSDDDDDGILDDIGEFIAKDTASTFFGTVPGLSALVDQFRGYDSGGVMANAFGAYAKLREQAAQGEMDRAAVKAAVSAVGVTLGLPSSQANKTIDAIAARADGEDVSLYEYLTGPEKKK